MINLAKNGGFVIRMIKPPFFVRVWILFRSLLHCKDKKSPTHNYIFPHHSLISSQIVRKNQVFCLCPFIKILLIFLLAPMKSMSH